MAPRNWNPKEPYVLGMEWPGMRTLALPLSQEAEYGHTFQANATETIDIASFEIVGPPVTDASVSTGLVTVYKRDNNNIGESGDELEYGTVTTTTCLVNGGALGGATIVGGAASIAAALASPADDDYLLIEKAAADQVTLEFATNGLFAGKRILEVKMSYLARAATDSATPSGRVIVRTGADLGLVGEFAADAFDAYASPLRTLSFGECNYAVAGTDVWPYTVADVDAFDSGVLLVRVDVGGVDNDVDLHLHYLTLEVVWCEENRQAVGGTILRQGHDAPTVGDHDVHLRAPGGTDNWAKTLDAYYTVTVTSARSPGPFIDAVTDRLALSMKQTQGESPLIPLVDGFDVFANHQGRVSSRLPSNVLGALGSDSRLCPIKFQTTTALVPTDGDTYDRTVAAQVYSGGPAQVQEIEQWSGGGPVSYPWIRFYARIVGDPADVPAIDITTVDGTMGYLATALLLLPEIFDGWREVTLQWPAPIAYPLITNAGTDKAVTFSTTQGSITNRWEILGVDSANMMLEATANGNPTYGGDDTMWIKGATTHNYADLAVTLHTAPPAISGFDSFLTSIDLGAGTFEGAPEPCVPDTFYFPYLTWTASGLSDAEFGYYEVQRQDTIDTTWRTIGEIAAKATVLFYDVEARRSVASSYRMRLCRADRICGAWTATETITAPSGAAGDPCGVLFFSTNDSPLSVVAYAESFDGAPEEGFSFVEAGWVQQQHHYGRFGTQSFHPTERGGVSFVRTILVSGLAVPAANATADKAYTALRDLAWLDVAYVCVMDDQGNRWFATLTVPDAVVMRRAQIFLASIQVTESTQTPFPVTAQ